MGEAVGKYMDYSATKFDVRLIAGSTLPVNRWAYLAELKELMKMGVVDDVAVLSETDIKNKDKIVQRKSLYAQMKQQMEAMEKKVQDKEGTIETLERQLVQAGIKTKVMQGEMEVNRKVAENKAKSDIEYNDTKQTQKQIRDDSKMHAKDQKDKIDSLLNSLPVFNKEP